MVVKHERPDYVLNFPKPINTDIRFINGHWYLYERMSVYDHVTKRRYKKTLRCLGKITPEGLVPSKPRKNKHPEGSTPVPNNAEQQIGAPVAKQGQITEDKTEADVEQSQNQALSSSPVPSGQEHDDEPFLGDTGTSSDDDTLEGNKQHIR